MTARDYIYQMIDTYEVKNSPYKTVLAGEKTVEAAMIAFAQEKVKEALQAAAENAEVNIEYGHGDWMLSMTVEKCEVDKESILNAYPLQNVR